MANLKFDKEITALLVIDPYNDFISEGGKVWDRLRGVAEANNCIPHMTAVLDAARAATCALCASSSLPPRRLRNLEVHCTRSEGRVVTKDLRVRHVGLARFAANSHRKRAISLYSSTGARAALPIRTWISSSRGTASRGSSSSGSSHTRASKRRYALPRNWATTSQWSGARLRIIRTKRCTPRSTSTSRTTPMPSSPPANSSSQYLRSQKRVRRSQEADRDQIIDAPADCRKDAGILGCSV